MRAVVRVLLFCGSVFISAIPERYRRWWPWKTSADLRAAAIISGVMQALIGIPGSVLFVAAALTTGFGLAGIILNPYVPSAFLFIEGMVRLLAALSSEQILPTLPLQVVAWIHTQADRKAAERALGPLVSDRIEPVAGKPFELRVSSCRPKPHWNPYMTIRFQDEFYQMLKEEKVAGIRQHVYYLRQSPPGRAVVVVYEYHPDDVLTPELPQRWRPAD